MKTDVVKRKLKQIYHFFEKIPLKRHTDVSLPDKSHKEKMKITR